MYHCEDTIAAIASAAGGAARGIVRVAGPDTANVLATCFHPNAASNWRAVTCPTAISGRVDLQQGKAALPATVYFWPDRRSYTRQPAAEIHTLGSPPLLSALLDTLCAAGARLAEPGEFTLRAFFAGRLDLVQAEAVLGVIDAGSESDLETALAQLAGGLTRPLHGARESLLNLLAHLEAGLDFVEEDIEFVSRAELANQLASIDELLARTLRQLTNRRHTETLPRIALVGWPNVGKSSLFNALVGAPAAITSDQAGTTRDYLTATLDGEGLRCQLIDTAGREPPAAGDLIGAAAQELSLRTIAHCDLELFCVDSSRTLNDWERTHLTSPPRLARIIVATKCDVALPGGLDLRTSQVACSVVETSAATNRGIDTLRQHLMSALEELNRHESAAALTAERCAGSLRAASAAIQQARGLIETAGGDELIAAELRLALDELGKVVGAVYTDDILDRVFSRFCIGK